MNDFYYHFCKVEFLCYAYKPNWLGWLVLLFGTLGILYIILRIYFSEIVQELVEEGRRENKRQIEWEKKRPKAWYDYAMYVIFAMGGLFFLVVLYAFFFIDE